MSDYNMIAGVSFTGSRLAKYKEFLQSRGLHDEEDADYTVMFVDDDDEPVACGSLSGSVLKQIAVSDAAEGGGVCASVVTELQNEAVRRKKSHLFLYTKPENKRMFTSLGFTAMAETDSVLMMENRRKGLSGFLDSIPKHEGAVGCIVCNCDPMTKGHLYLMERAASECDFVYVFVLSEDGGHFPPEDRYKLVCDGTKHLDNLLVLHSEDYLISRSTFPAYFLKATVDVEKARSDLDLILFATRIAPALNITRRYVGTEPFCPVTNAYNVRMLDILPEYGIEVREIPRKDNISASRVRELLGEGNLSEIRELVPENVYEYLAGKFTANA